MSTPIAGPEFEDLLAALRKTKEKYELMSRLADVELQLRAWAVSGDEFAGGDASNALDQLRGLVEDLPRDSASELEVLADLLKPLPLPWE